MSIKVGDRIKVINQSRYDLLDLIGKKGTVKGQTGAFSDSSVAVELDGLTNDSSIFGYFYFKPKELLVIDEFCKECHGECYGAYPKRENCELHADSVVDRFNSLGLPNYVKSDERKEYKMCYNGVKIKVGNKFYYPDSVEWKQTHDTFPELEISTRISPSNLDPTCVLSITNVIFNPPATIVFWSDNTKTVVKCDPKEEYDPEKGIAMAICKKMMGDNKRQYYNVFLHWLKKYEKQQKEKEEIDKVFERLKLFVGLTGVEFGNSDDEGDTCR